MLVNFRSLFYYMNLMWLYETLFVIGTYLKIINLSCCSNTIKQTLVNSIKQNVAWHMSRYSASGLLRLSWSPNFLFVFHNIYNNHATIPPHYKQCHRLVNNIDMFVSSWARCTIFLLFVYRNKIENKLTNLNTKIHIKIIIPFPKNLRRKITRLI